MVSDPSSLSSESSVSLSATLVMTGGRGAGGRRGPAAGWGTAAGRGTAAGGRIAAGGRNLGRRSDGDEAEIRLKVDGNSHSGGTVDNCETVRASWISLLLPGNVRLDIVPAEDGISTQRL
jgi:hypothetical protein